MASIWLFVASFHLMALGTRGSNFAASDKPVFHGFENIHFENKTPPFEADLFASEQIARYVLRYPKLFR